jgi:anti-sigma28 factor (negative regulator of flagellin synthesis)
MAKGYALCIGLNKVSTVHYGGWDGALSVCEKDARDIKNIAVKMGFTADILLTKDATSTNVLSKIDQAAATLKSGDIFFLYYSGHGGNEIPDINKDEIEELADEVDGYDESWCCYDQQVIDDILYQRWFKFKPGVRILVVSDSCFSGDIVKLVGGKLVKQKLNPTAVKRMPPMVGHRVFQKNAASYRKFNRAETPLRKTRTKALPQATLKATVRQISSSSEYQPSYANTNAYPNNSLFTAIFKKAIKNGKYKGDYNQFVKKLKQGMPYDQQPNHQKLGAVMAKYDKQTPLFI